MTLPVNQQNCGNCYFARTMPFSAVNDSVVPYLGLACCYAAPGTMGNTPTTKQPWRQIASSYWCGVWSDVGPQNVTQQAIGTATIDFGSSFQDYATIFVSQDVIPSSAHIRAWLLGREATGNDADDHILAGLWTKISTTIATANTGFTIHVLCLIGRARGQFRIDWSWA